MKMPRQARKKSEKDEDYVKFLQIVEDYQAISKYKVYAYCLMSNHIHLLIREEEEPLEQIFKRIGSKYVYWYNVKYQRKGHLFQDRFKSETVDNETYFLTVIRYIHQNPVKAGICEKIDDYKYSSFQEYFSKTKIVDTDFVFKIVSRSEFEKFNRHESSAKCLDIEENKPQRVTDEQAKAIIRKCSKCDTIADFQLLDRKTRDEYLRLFKENGISIRQISRLTGVSYYIVQKI